MVCTYFIRCFQSYGWVVLLSNDIPFSIISIRDNAYFSIAEINATLCLPEQGNEINTFPHLSHDPTSVLLIPLRHDDPAFRYLLLSLNNDKHVTIYITLYTGVARCARVACEVDDDNVKAMYYIYTIHIVKYLRLVYQRYYYF